MVCTAIVRMARALSIEVIAEGVENELRVGELNDLGCRLGQGFHFHKPLPADGISPPLSGEARQSAGA